MKSLHCVFYVLIINITVAQENLVPNRSFEIYSDCPQSISEIYKAIPWFQPSTYFGNIINSSSSDFFHRCSPVGSFSVSVPNNFAGYREPKTGNGYAGIGLFLKRELYKNVREYIEVRLLSPLVKNKEYCVSFYVSLADTSGYAISNISLFFSVDSLLDSTFLNIGVTPHIENDYSNIINNKNWVLITGIYTATGGEQFITIGNFDNDSNTNFVKVDGTTGDFAYYYIDDVSVVLCEDTLNPTDTFYLHIPNIFTPNADGQNDAWEVRARGVQQLSAAVYNRWGALLWQQSITDTTAQTEIKTAWSGYTSTGLPVSAGTYYYLVSYTTKEGETKKEKGFLTLVR